MIIDDVIIVTRGAYRVYINAHFVHLAVGKWLGMLLLLLLLLPGVAHAVSLGILRVDDPTREQALCEVATGNDACVGQTRIQGGDAGDD